MADQADEEQPFEQELVEELGARLDALKHLHGRANSSWDRPMTVMGAASVIGGSIWTLLAPVDPVGLLIAVLGAMALANDQAYRVRRDERNALERRRQLDLVINSLAKFLELRTGRHSGDE